MEAFAHVCDAVAATSKRLEKIALVATYLRTLDADNLESAARFFHGSLLAPEEPDALIGYRTIFEAAAHAFHVKSVDIRNAVRTTGELGEALGTLYEPVLDFGLLRETLTPAVVRDRLRHAAYARGPRAQAKRRATVESLLRDARDAREVAIIVKLLTAELRIGLREGTLLDALAQAFERNIEDVRKAAAANSDIGFVACAAKADSLAAIEPVYGRPIAAMLASPIIFGSNYDDVETGAWIIEDKFDGIRAQLHVSPSGVKIFSRTGGVLEGSFPEIVQAALVAFSVPVMLDGEIIAVNGDRPLPFAQLQPRILRKDPDATMQADIPVRFVAFDVLAEGKTVRIAEPWDERRAALERLFADAAAHPHLGVSTAIPLAEPRAFELERAFSAARARGNEGLMLKRNDAVYTAGRRGRQWLKLKKEFATLDVVVVGVEWGHGKRAKLLSDYTFAVRGDDGDLKVIGKAYSGLTDAEIGAYTQHFLSVMTGAMRGARTHAVPPEVILEIAFDRITASPLHDSGFALRFPRIVRIRDDKGVQDIATLSEVRAMVALLAAEGSGSAPAE